MGCFKGIQRKFLSGVLIISGIFGAFSFVSPEAASAAPSYCWQKEADTVVVSDTSYLPVRDVLLSYGIQVEWVTNEVQPKLVLKDGVGTYQVTVDMKNKEAKCGKAEFRVENKDGRICLPAQFYSLIIGNAEVTWSNDNKVLTVVPKDINGTFVVQNVPEYVEEPKTEASKQEIASLEFYESGQATWYGAALHGNLTASGEPFNMYDNTAAHKTLPFGTRVKVTNMQNGKSVVVRITDRGPFAPGRVIDLSMAAAQQVDMISSGVVPAKLEIVR